MNYTIKNDFYTATVSTTGAELISLIANGRECIWDGNREFWGDHAPLLFPICGQIKDKEYKYADKKYKMNGHGFARREEFIVIEKSDGKITLCLKENENTLSQYPFSFELYATYELSGDRLLADFTVRNTGNELMPYMFGWHPGFMLFEDGGACINDYYVDFGKLTTLAMHPLQNGPFANPVSEEYPLTDGKIRICEEYLYPRDTMIMVNHENGCTLGSEKNTYKVFVEWSENLPVLALWKANDGRAKFFCVEPWTQMPADGVSEENFEIRKMERLKGGEQATYSYKVKITF